jgi:hypothetical protein
VTDQEKAAEVWSAALDAPHGVKVETDDVQRLVACLYEVKRQSADPRLLQYTILVAKTRAPLKTNGEYRPLEGV